MIALSNTQMETLMTIGAQVPHGYRGRYLRAVTDLMRQHPDCDDGDFRRACITARAAVVPPSKVLFSDLGTCFK